MGRNQTRTASPAPKGLRAVFKLLFLKLIVIHNDVLSGITSPISFSATTTKFWFINQQVEATFRSFNLLYPDNLVGRGVADERVHPIVYYDHRFANYLNKLLDAKIPFLGLAPRTPAYYFLAGLFLRFLWATGTRWQLVPVLRVDLRYIRSPLFFKSFYTTLTPLSLSIQIYYRFKFHLQPQPYCTGG